MVIENANDKALGYRVATDHFQMVLLNLAPEWVLNSLRIIASNQ